MAALQSSVNARRNRCPASAVNLATSYIKWSCHKPSRPAAEPGADALMAAITSNSVMVRRCWSGSGISGGSPSGFAG
ncbi:hypothetical protein E2C01_044318 [Portunus trituberculatus]|uniref:Uncharacterized protein n=1 Tax=Portunus trituberculatus TaxID=210409 RepID=A0A5B7G041_PORTR|nr:hypothetical protein [Portunus trituberculatus]